MKTSPQLVLLAAVLALVCGVAAAVIAIRVLQAVLGA
jgi:hypothetical protein